MTDLEVLKWNLNIRGIKFDEENRPRPSMHPKSSTVITLIAREHEGVTGIKGHAAFLCFDKRGEFITIDLGLL